ncbi:MAG TPA: hypothetical protein PLY88_03795 [Candidatus Omnitrophota bacterium]|nr:hypothetical protein [Candidatus Omnitrophota bacterium]
MNENEKPKNPTELPEFIAPQDSESFEPTAEQKFRASVMLNHSPLRVVFFVLIGIVIGYLGYVYFFQLPALTITDANARYSQTNTGGYRVTFNFKVKNTGNGKTSRNELHTAFLDLRGTNQNRQILAYSGVALPELKEEQIYTVPKTKEIYSEKFEQYLKTDRGLFLSVVLRWKSNFWAFRNRTFENHLLLFLKQSLDQTFEIYYVHQSQWNWGVSDDTLTPNMMKLANRIDLKRPGYEN